jgi:hypothetical protein
MINYGFNNCVEALYISVFQGVCQEIAFHKVLDRGKFDKKSPLNDEDTKDMIKFKNEGMTWKEIGEIYGILDSTACQRVKRYLKRSELDERKGKVETENI